MPLFTRNFYLGLILICFYQFLAQAQNCQPPTIFFPDTVCAGQMIRGINMGPTNSNYDWDVCAGDLFKPATATPITIPGLSGILFSIEIIEEGGLFYGFTVSNSTTLYRLEYGSNINSSPTVINLGNPGSVLASSYFLDIEKQNGIYYGFTVNRASGQIVRITFNNGINFPPTAETLPPIAGLGSPFGINISQDGNNFIGFCASTSSNKLFVINFSDSLAKNPAIESVTIPIANYNAMATTADCNGKYVFLGDAGGKLTRVSFGESYLNPLPIATQIIVAPTFAGALGSIAPLNEGGRSTLLIAGAGSAVVNFGSTFQNNSVGVTTASTSVTGVFGLSKNYYLNNENAYFFYVTSSGVYGKLSFSNGTCNFTGPKNQYSPPTFSYSIPGKYFVNYKIKDILGKTTYSGDSIVVKNGAIASGPSPVFDFTADDQCPSRPTKFNATVNPTGSYVYNWSFPGNNSSTIPNPSFQFSTPGIYPVTLRLRPLNGCGVGSITKEVKIYPNPTSTIVSAFSVPAQICTKDSVQFLDGSSPTNQAKRWLWDFGNGQIFTIKNPKVYFPFNPGNQTFQVSFKASDSSGCATAVSNPVLVKPGADIQFAVSKVCIGETSEFSNNTPNISQASYVWNFGNPASGSSNTSTSGAPSVSYVFTDTGEFNVKLQATTSNGCVSSVNSVVRIYPVPKIDFSFPLVTFPNIYVPFTNKSSAQYQVVTNYNWNFGDPGIPLNDTSTNLNPKHTYLNIGEYQVNLKGVSNKGCRAEITKTLYIYPPCPILNYTKTATPGVNQNILTINNQTLLVKEIRFDFCAGDLELTPVLQSQSSGITNAINGASQVIPIKDNGKWIGFIPSPVSANGVCFFKSKFGNSLNNDIDNFDINLGSLQGKFPTPTFIRFIKEDTVWYGIASNGDQKLWRIRFGKFIENNSPVITEIPVPVGTFVVPTSAQFVKDKDTTYLFVTNNNGLTTNNLIKLRFKNSIADTPVVSTLINTGDLLNSNGFFNISFAKECDKWFGFLLGTSQLYKLSYGNSLNNRPTAGSITSEIPLPGGATAFNNMRGITMLQDLGKWYGLINNNSGGLVRVRFGNGLSQSIDKVTFLGTFGITGVVGAFNFIQDQSEVFGLTINAQGLIYKIKFPNRCPANPSNGILNSSGTVDTRYSVPGTYYFTVTGETAFGATTQRLDSVVIPVQTLNKVCRTTELRHPEELCFNNRYNASTIQQGLSDVKWDFCTGDFKLPPEVLVSPVSSQLVSISGIQTILEGTNYYTFINHASGISRINIGDNPGVTNFPNHIPIILSALGVPSEFKMFKEDNKWFAICIYSTGESIARLNFGTDITNTKPTISVINLPGSLTVPRGLSLFEDKGIKYAMIANQNEGKLVLLNFGNTYRNIPFPLTIDVPGAINLFKVNMIRDCNIWHAFVTDEKQDSLYQLTFNRGLESNPVFKLHGIIDPVGIQAIKEGNEYYLFATKNQPLKNNLFRFSFGNSLNNNPRVDSLTNFGTSVPNSGLTNVYAFQIFQNNKSEHFLFGHGFSNLNLYRIKFKNQCSANQPVAYGDTIKQQAYSVDGKYYFTTEGYTKDGELVSGFDSVQVKNLVEAKFNIPGTRCKGESVLFTDASIPGDFTNITSWNWSFGDSLSTSDSSTVQNPSYNFAEAGIYPVRLRVIENGGCVNETTKEISIVDKPTPKITIFSSGPICTNDSILFQDSSTTINDPIISRIWEIKRNNILLFTSIKKDPRFLFNEIGDYTASLKITGQSQCDNTISKSFVVNSVGPLVSFTNASPCLNEPIPFKAQISGSSIDSIRWFVDAGKYARQDSMTYTFTSADIFRVTLVTYKNGCTNNFSKILKVNARPQVSIDFQTPEKCQGTPVNFSTILITNENVKYKWNFGNGKTDTLKNPVSTFDSAGTFLVKLVVTTENGCIGKDSSLFKANRAPKALFVFDKACLRETINFTNTSFANGIPGGITNYIWDFNGIPSTQEDPAPNDVLTITEGTKTVKLTVRTAECSNSYIDTIVVGPKLAANFGIDIGCIGTPFRFYDLSSTGPDAVSSYNWTIAGASYTTRTPIVLLEKGSHNIKLVVKSNNGCTDFIERNNFVSSVNDSAKADFSFSSGIFSEPPFRVAFKALPKVDLSYSYSWDLGDGTIINDTVPQPHLYQKEDVYVVKLTAKRNGTICSTTVSKVLNVIANPIQGLKLRKLSVGRGSERLSMALEVENQSNIALRSFDIVTKVGNLITLKETWNGILFPQSTITIQLKSDILSKNSQNVQFICASLALSEPKKETSPEDNNQCLSIDSFPAIVALYPNPATSQFVVELNLPTSDPIEFRLVNNLGQTISNVNLEQPAVGAFAQQFDVSKLNAGLYYLWFRSGKKIEHRSLMIQND